MLKLLTLLAKAMPLDTLIDTLGDDIKEYQATRETEGDNVDNSKKIFATCMMITMKETSKGMTTTELNEAIDLAQQHKEPA